MVEHLAALGSSFAAGPGIDPVENRWAMRSGGNYAHLVAAQLGARLTDLTVSGATTATILDQPQRFLWHRFPPQMDRFPSDADLVTVTAGGNDLGYLGSMLRLGHAGLLGRHRFTAPLTVLFGQLPSPTPDMVDAAADGLVAIVGAVHERAPAARVLLVDYLTILGPHTPDDRAAPFEAVTRDTLRAVGDAVVRVFTTAGARSGAEVVSVAERSRDHVLGSAEPWVNGLRIGSPASFHPNAAGMRAVAEAIVEHVVGDGVGRPNSGGGQPGI